MRMQRTQRDTGQQDKGRLRLLRHRYLRACRGLDISPHTQQKRRQNRGGTNDRKPYQEAQAEAIRTEIKADMESRGVDELKIKDFIAQPEGNYFLPDVYSQYVKQTKTRRFTITV